MGCNGPCDMDDEPLSGLSSVSNCLFRVQTTAPEEVGNVSKGCESDIVEHLSERVTESLDLDYDDSGDGDDMGGDGDDMGFGQGMCSEEACLISNSFLDIEDRPAVFLSPERSNAVTNLNSSAVQDVVSVSRDGQENRSWNNDLSLSVKILQDEACVSELCPEESSLVGQLCCSVGTQESLMGTKEFQHEGGIISTAQDKEMCFLKSPLNTSPGKCTQQHEQEDPKMFVPSGESEEKHYILPGSSIALTTQVSHTEEDNFNTSESPQSNHTQQNEYKDDEIFIPSDEEDKVCEENVEERHNALHESNEMTRLPDTQENNSCNLIEGPPNMASECAIEDSASLLLSQHLGVVSISSFNCSVTQNHQEIDSLADASACSLIDSTVQTFNEMKDTVEADFASTSTFTDIVHLSPQIRTQQSKSSDMIPRRKTARLRTLVNSIVPAKPIAISSEISRGKRSRPSKQARSSIWGTLGNIMDVFTEHDGLVKHELEPEPQFNQKQRSNKRNNGQGGKRRKNSRAGGNSRTPRKAKSCVTTGRIRLKVKIEEEDRGQTSPNVLPPDVIESLESVPIVAGEISSKPVFSGEISELVNDVECKMAEIVHDTGADLENLVTFQGSSIQDFLHHGDTYTAENVHDTTFTTCRADLQNSVTFRGASVESTGAHDISVRSTLSDCPWVSSQNKMETLVEAVDCRYTDPGTSPDSEVINLVQEDTAGTRESVLHDSVCIEGCPGGSSIVSGPDELGERFKVETVLQSFETSGRLFPTSKPAGLKIPKCPKSSSGLSKRRSRAPDSARREDGSTPPKQKGDSRKSVNKGKSKKDDTLALAMSKGEIQLETDEGADMFPKMGNHSELHGLPELNSSNIVGAPSDAQEKPKNDSKVAPEDFSESSVSNAFDQQLLPSRNAWVLCDDCHKWRCIPAALADSIEETNCQWTCKENMDKAFADCSIPQEKTNAEINAELDISDASGEEDVCNAQSNRKGVEARKISDSKPASWTLIKTNSFLHRKRKTQVIDEIMVCHCKPPQDGQLGCGDECLNRLLNIECVHGTCPCSDLCSNQQFQKRKYAKFQWFRCGKKGFGLQLQQNVPEGAFLIEYVGEVLDLHSYEVRQKEYASRGQKHFYFMTLNGSEVIDACGKGNLGRFINHSCDPNCRTEKWMVNGEVCVGLFALRDLKKGEEVTFDYNYVRVFGAAAKRCKCGSSVCRGYIGGDPSNSEVVVQGDSDEEYPEPSMVTEDSYYADFVDENSDFSLADGAIVEHGECTVNASDTVCTSSIKQVEQSPEKGSVSVSSFEPLVSAEGTARESPSHGPGVLLQTQDTMFKSSSGFPSLQTQDVTSSAPITQPLETSVTTKLISKSLSDSDPANKKYISESLEEKSNISKPQPVVKSSRPSVSVKKVKSNSSAVTSSKARVVANKPKKLLEATSNNRLEGVEDKLNELLDSDGGISKRKDATKGYLKLLLVTAASGDNVNGEAVQSTRDLSIILDALLKTKSRMVLADIISKNGLQMLHNVMKHNRRNFNKTPIIRKLLKALEYLAVKKILTIEQINRVPPRAEIESFRESILELTRHSDVQVHQIARNFRDTWIPRPTRRYGHSNRENGNLELHNGSSFNRTSVSRKRWHDNDGVKPMEDINSHLHIGSSDPATDGYRNNGANIRKRKSRWDQLEVNAKVPERTEVDENLKGKQKMELNAHHTDMELAGERNISNGCYQSNLSQGDLVQEIHDDAPPGFPALFSSSPTLVSNTSSSTASPSSLLRDTNTDCGGYCELVTGCIQGRYMSHLTVSYGIPLSFVEQLGTTEAGVLDSWVTAPSIPFHPFPPLPRFPREESNSLTSPSSTMKHNEGGCKEEVLREGNWHQEDINMTSTSGRARPPEGSATWGRGNNCKRMVDEPMRYFSAGSGNLGQRYFRQRKWNSNRRNGPPWGSRRNNGMGWKESGNNCPRNGVQNIDLGNVENLHGDRGESENKNNASTVFQERPQYGYE